MADTGMIYSRALAALIFASLSATPVLAQQPAYSGKRLTILVNYAAGGPTDVEARVFAKYLTRHIDGAPSVIVQNMDGAGGLTGTNFLGEVAPRDGTMLGYLTGAAWQSASESRPRRVDFRSYEFVAYQPGTSIYFVRADVAPGMRKATDIAHAQGLISGGVGVDNAKDILLRMTMQMLSVPLRHVTGYKGSQGARLALQQGEINFYSEGPAAYRAAIEPGMVSKGEAIPVFYDPGYNGVSTRALSAMNGLDIKPFDELYRDVKNAEPTGQLWDAYRTIIALSGAMQRLIVVPPGAPQPAIDALQKAIAAMSADSAFREECAALGFQPEYVAGAHVSNEVRQALAIPPEMKAFIRDYTEVR